jgi:hypothetical protein
VTVAKGQIKEVYDALLIHLNDPRKVVQLLDALTDTKAFERNRSFHETIVSLRAIADDEVVATYGER